MNNIQSQDQLPPPPPPPRKDKVLGVALAVMNPNTITVIIFSPHPKSIQPFKTSGKCVFHQVQHTNFIHYVHNVHYVIRALNSQF